MSCVISSRWFTEVFPTSLSFRKLPLMIRRFSKKRKLVLTSCDSVPRRDEISKLEEPVSLLMNELRPPDSNSVKVACPASEIPSWRLLFTKLLASSSQVEIGRAHV